MANRAQAAPVLIARVDNELRDFLESAALKRRVVYVHLESAPSENGVLHRLEVHAPGASPLVLVAEPLGPTIAQGTPLRLQKDASGSAPAPRKTVAYASGVTARQPPPAPPKDERDQKHVETLQEIPAAEPAPASSIQHSTLSPQSLVGRSLAAGKLTIEAFVGEGGAGAVFRARHRDLQMSVAVKVLHESYQNDAAFCLRFHAEALSASRLDHANLTRVLDFGQEPDGLLYIAMEFLDGKTLRDILVSEGPMPFARASQIMIQVCSGLTHAHARSIIHRDIKPENLVIVRGLDDDGRETEIVKVCDFGIAHRSAVESQAIFAGTAEYISPEMYNGDAPDVQSDVYACGVVLYELLTGRVPIEGDIPEIVPRVLAGKCDPPSKHVREIDPRVDRLVLKSIAKDREVRHASVRELRAELRSLAEEIAVFSAGGYYDDAPASVRPAARPPASDGMPDWLEQGTGYLEQLAKAEAPHARIASSKPPASSPRASTGRPSYGSLPDIPSSRPSLPAAAIIEGPGGIIHGSHVSMTPSMAPESGDDSAKLIAPFLQKLADTREPAKFKALTDPLPPRIHELLKLGHRQALWRLCATLDMIAREKEPRAEIALGALEIFKDKDVLAGLAIRALDGVEDKGGHASKLIVRAGRRGAHALYGARLKHGVFEARERFVALLTEIGAAGVPVLKTALEHLESRLAVPGALYVVEDLLRSVPDVGNEELGVVLARYVKSPHAPLALQATIALPRAWRERARPLLLAQVHHKEDDVAIAAIRRIKELWKVDKDVLAELAILVSGKTGAHPPVRLAATEALNYVTPDAKPRAQSLLAMTLEQTEGNTPDVEDMIVMLAGTLIAIGGNPAFVTARWRSSTAWLRTRLEAVLRKAKQI